MVTNGMGNLMSGSWVTAGHWTDQDARTGCTVILLDKISPAVAEVRGGAPGTRETDLLGQGHLVGGADAILLSGGSAFGLSAADGVVRYLRERARGHPTSAGPVPIVSAAVIYDLSVGEPTWPDSEAGFSAADRASPLHHFERGPIGAGTGATSSKLWGLSKIRPGGVGLGVIDVGRIEVAAIAVVNAVGQLSSSKDDIHAQRIALLEDVIVPGTRESTTLVVVMINGRVDGGTLHRCAVAAHCGIARTIVPSHTLFDGDTVFVVCPEEGRLSDHESLQLSIATELAVEAAILDSIAHAQES
jgi:L-aminopeptidase/D-esterase-like protein